MGLEIGGVGRKPEYIELEEFLRRRFQRLV